MRMLKEKLSNNGAMRPLYAKETVDELTQEPDRCACDIIGRAEAR